MQIFDIFDRCKYVNGCLEWQGALNTDGYPRGLINGDENAKLHREIFNALNGYYPKVVRHSCDNILCLNPIHLIGGNDIDNVKDRHNRNRTHNQVSDQDIQNVKLLRNQGQSFQDISDVLGIRRKRVEYIYHQYVKEN